MASLTAHKAGSATQRDVDIWELFTRAVLLEFIEVSSGRASAKTAVSRTTPHLRMEFLIRPASRTCLPFLQQSPFVVVRRGAVMEPARRSVLGGQHYK